MNDVRTYVKVRQCTGVIWLKIKRGKEIKFEIKDGIKVAIKKLRRKLIFFNCWWISKLIRWE